MKHIASLHFEINGPTHLCVLENIAYDWIRYLVNRGLITNDLTEEDSLEAFWSEVVVVDRGEASS